MINSVGMSFYLICAYIVIAVACAYLMINMATYLVKQFKIGRISRVFLFSFMGLLALVIMMMSSFAMRYDKIIRDLTGVGHETQMTIWAVGVTIALIAFPALAITTRNASKSGEFDKYIFLRHFYKNDDRREG